LRRHFEREEQDGRAARDVNGETLFTWTPEAWRQFPLFSGPQVGVGMLSAGLILAIMVIPFIASRMAKLAVLVPAALTHGAKSPPT
jgi:phosphate transport system permease protein